MWFKSLALHQDSSNFQCLEGYTHYVLSKHTNVQESLQITLWILLETTFNSSLEVPVFVTMNAANYEIPFLSAQEYISNFDFGLQSADLHFLRTDSSLLE